MQGLADLKVIGAWENDHQVEPQRTESLCKENTLLLYESLSKFIFEPHRQIET